MTAHRIPVPFQTAGMIASLIHCGWITTGQDYNEAVRWARAMIAAHGFDLAWTIACDVATEVSPICDSPKQATLAFYGGCEVAARKRAAHG